MDFSDSGEKTQQENILTMKTQFLLLYTVIIGSEE